jgi:hypothetical protein
MTSQARIKANRLNSKRSTGPRSAHGRKIVSMNALTHGMAAKTIVLPNENIDAYLHRRETWPLEIGVPGEHGDFMVGRMMDLSWQLDRAIAHEQARLTRRVRNRPRERERSRRRRAEATVRQVLSSDPVEAKRTGRTLDRAERVDRLQSSVHGCRALLKAWADLQKRLSVKPGSLAGLGDWILSLSTAALRLLGIDDHPDPAASTDLRVDRIVEAVRIASQHTAFAQLQREIASRSQHDEDDAVAEAVTPLESINVSMFCDELLIVITSTRGRLSDLLQDLQAEAVDQVADDAAEAAFDASPEGERVHRYQAQWGRAMIQTLEAIRKLKRDAAMQAPAEEVVVPPQDRVESPGGSPASSGSTPATQACVQVRPRLEARRTKPTDSNQWLVR